MTKPTPHTPASAAPAQSDAPRTAASHPRHDRTTTPDDTTPDVTTPDDTAASHCRDRTTPAHTAARRRDRTLTPGALARAALGWLAVGALAIVPATAFAPANPPAPPPAIATPTPFSIATPLVLLATVAVIVVCAFGVVHQAEHIARRLGDPLGTLVLTLSIVLIEVVLIVAVMLGPGEHTTIARDSVLAVSMIILNLVIGLALLVGGIRRGGLRHNRSGTSAYLAVLVVLLALTFGMPSLGVGAAASFAPVVAVLTAGLYAFFLWRQTGAQAADFTEPARPRPTGRPTNDVTEPVGPRHPARRPMPRAHRRELLTRIGLLVATVLPIVLLSHDMASMLDDTLAVLHAPPALSGMLIAIIVFLPEALTAVRAGWRGEMQRVSNLCHGALVSTVGLTVPAVLVVGMLTGSSPVFAVDGGGMLLLGATLALSITTFSSRRVGAVHGAAHVALFAVYALAVFA